ncbi:hypothetical protein [Salinispira pacifica]
MRLQPLLFTALLLLLGLFAPGEPVRGQPKRPFSVLLIEGRRFDEAWRTMDQLIGPPGAKLTETTTAEELLGALPDLPMIVSEGQRETLILRVLDALLGYGSARGGAAMPPSLSLLYRSLPRFSDPMLRARILTAVAPVVGLDTKPLLIESMRLVRQFEELGRVTAREPVPVRRFPEDVALEREAEAVVYACRGRVDGALAGVLSDIARLSRRSSTVEAARALAREFWASRERSAP